ncbi:glutamate 5-kinase [Sansalvadorimonas sp. 2012CJ34-2]|uniref:Glutamate 5-kinase n=1 Tax=Parendozoicomonas callyspongiae TaxID=2942213 RepID=A0ABT0PG22_9GAMM|nr:glutamate 5-kinase [Sansalvadorimonas sp. 2012CJ34-2]MCL6269473.1 glutamate 5-kinase [Sansalvadorimonas sp. 2012CJ34-2]
MVDTSVSGRSVLKNGRRWVIKIGSALLTADGKGLDESGIRSWVAQMAELRNQGVELVLVSSGAIAAGMSRLGWQARPSAMHELQVAAAVGQMGLSQTWQSAFAEHGIETAQVLLTHADLSNRQRYLNARSALSTMLSLGVIPVINENDCVVTDEIRFGDNDTLGALAANLVEADVLVLLTDQDGLFTADPRTNPDAVLVDEKRASDSSLDAMAGEGKGALGRGGMFTKLRASRLAARSGASTVIAGGRIEQVIERLKDGESLGTLLLPDEERTLARKRWLAGHLRMKGRLVLDAGAVRALKEAGSSLLPVGVRGVEGVFQRGEMVACVSPDGAEVARGLVNYSSEQVGKVLGMPSHQMPAVLGFAGEPELVHRDNMVVL